MWSGVKSNVTDRSFLLLLNYFHLVLSRTRLIPDHFSLSNPDLRQYPPAPRGPDAFHSAKMLCDQYYLRSPDLVLREMSGKRF